MAYPTAQALKIKVDGVDRTSLIPPSSILITQTGVDAMDTCSFDVNRAGGLGISELDTVIVSNVGETVRYFAGYLTIKVDDPIGPLLNLRCVCQDYTYLLDKTTVNEQFSAQTDKAIIASLFSDYRDDIDATTYVVAQLTATEIPLITFNRISLQQSLDLLAEESRALWHLDYGPGAGGKLCSLHYFPRETNVAPYNISDSPDLSTTFPCENLKVTRDATDHINRVTVVGGDYLSGDTDHFFPMDGTETITLLPHVFEAPVGQSLIQVWKNIVTKATSSELLTDTGLEIGGTGGDFDGGAELDDAANDTWDNYTTPNDVEATATVHGGSAAAKLITGALTPALYQRVSGVTAGKLYEVTFWTRGDGTNDITLRMFTNNEATLVWEETSGVTGTTYTEKSYYVTCPPGETTLTPYFLNFSGGTVYVDDISFKEVTTPVDERTPDWSAQTVGLGHLDDPGSYNVLWYKHDKHLLWAAAPSDLLLSVKVTARQLIPLRMIVENHVSYAAYGLWLDEPLVDVELVDIDTATQRARGLLNRHAVAAVIQCDVREPGLRAGDRITVTNTPASIARLYNIDRIITRFQAGGMALFNLEIS